MTELLADAIYTAVLIVATVTCLVTWVVLSIARLAARRHPDYVCRHYPDLARALDLPGESVDRLADTEGLQRRLERGGSR